MSRRAVDITAVLAPEDGVCVGTTESEGAHMDDTLRVVVAVQITVEDGHKA